MTNSGERLCKSIWWGAIVIAAAVGILHNFHIFPWMLDDAFISFRYSENLAKGLGLVYNAGERIEGYTTFLWVLILGLGKGIGLEIVQLARILAVVCAVGALGLLAFSYKMLDGWDRLTSALAVLFVGTCAIFTPWPSSGMEVSLFCGLILMTLLLYGSDFPQLPRSNRLALAGVSAGLAIMTRPEGVLLAAVLLAHAFYHFVKERDRTVLIFGLPLLIVYGPYFVWRYAYYGYFLPNTFYAKVGGSMSQVLRGLTYTGNWALACLPILALALLGVWKVRKGPLVLRLSATYVGIHLLYVIVVGGDCMPAFRFFAPLTALLALLAAYGLRQVTTKIIPVLLVALVVCGYNVWQMAYSPYIEGQINTDKVAVRGKAVGEWLKGHLPPGTLLATNTAGTIAYYSELPIVDMLGLNDVTIAHRKIEDMGSGMAGHEKGDGAYVLSRRPALIQFSSSIGSVQPYFRSDVELYESPAFHEQYSPKTVWIPDIMMRVAFYVRNDFPFAFQ